MSDSQPTSPARPQVLRVHRYDPQTSTSKQKQIIQLGDGDPIKDKTLKDIRKILIDNAVFESKDLKSPFCEKNGSDVSDDMKVELYLYLLDIKSITTPKLDFYFKKKKLFTKVDQATQDFIKQKLDLAFQSPPEVLKKNPQLLTSSFDPSAWKAVQGQLSHAADLNEKEWNLIIRSNCLLNGYRVVPGQDMKQRKLERCAYNAFKIKPREFESYEIAQSVEDSQKSDDANDPTQSIESAKKFKSRIPRFRVDDGSSVRVVETSNAFEKSCADSSFLEASIEMAGSVGIFGVSGGFKAGVGGNTSNKKTDKNNERNIELTVNYKYPRVTLYWDPSSLDVSTECLNDIKVVRDPESLQMFNNKYGVLFARRIQLGGRLSYSEAYTVASTAHVQELASKLKASASTSVSHSFAQASVNGSHEQQSRELKEDSEQKLTRNLAWEATGGDTLLCNNPAEWCGTVGLYSNWRIVKQDDVVPLYRFLASFSEVGEKIISRFELSAERMLSAKEEENFSRLEDQDDKDDGVKKERHQVFQLCLPKTGKFLGVSSGTQDLIDWLQNERDQDFYGNEQTPWLWDLDNLKPAEASIKCIFEDSNTATQFMADTVFIEGEEEKLKFQAPFDLTSCGHHPKLWVRVMRPFLKSFEGHQTHLLHLYGTGARRFTLLDAKDTSNTGHIPDGALVYLATDPWGSSSKYWATTVDEQNGYVKMTLLPNAREKKVELPVFIYKAKKIVEL